MIRIRPFLNSDVLALAEIWRSQPPNRALVQPITPAVLEAHIFSKPYFDRARLLLAVDHETPIGFVHAGFGATPDLATANCDVGIIAMLMVVPRPDEASIAAELRQQAESLLVAAGAKTFLAGGTAPHDPFYHGLYGGCQLPGVLESDRQRLAWFRDAGYEPVQRVVVLRLSLSSFRPIVNRQQMQIRRQFQLNTIQDPRAESWWEACTLGEFHRERCALLPRTGSNVASLDVVALEPLGQSWGLRVSELQHLHILSSHRRQGVGTFLLSEASRHLQSQGVAVAQAQVDESDEPARGLLAKLGFQPIDYGVILTRSAKR